MPLTADDVKNKRFTTVRLREGYDMGEVDQFLDEVESELRRLATETDELRAKLQAATGETPPPNGRAPETTTSGEPQATESSSDGERPTVATDGERDAVGGAASPPPATPQTAAAGAPVSTDGGTTVERIDVRTTADASAAATRLLEIAGRSADELINEAEQRAEQILSEARTQALALESETAERRRTLLTDIEQEKVRLNSDVEGLRNFEREYRSELRTYFEEQLAALDGQGAGGVLARHDTPSEAGGSTAAGSSETAEQRGRHDSQSGSPLQSILREDGS